VRVNEFRARHVLIEVVWPRKVPLTEIGGQGSIEGSKINQERLQSAYDHARKAVGASQLTEATALVTEFRSSDAYQWARGSRVAGTSGFDSSYRESLDLQSTSEHAVSRAKELARVAQFMNEWSRGAQTDFTNFAVRRLSERGLLREDDPIILQRAVSDIAYSYAKGGEVGSTFIPLDSPIRPSTPPSQLLGWGSSDVIPGKANTNRTANEAAISTTREQNEMAVQNRQSRHNAQPGQSVSNSGKPQTATARETIARTIESQRTQLLQSQGTLSSDYNDRVSIREVSGNHGGNKAVWDTVGAQSENRAKVGTEPGKSTMPLTSPNIKQTSRAPQP